MINFPPMDNIKIASSFYELVDRFLFTCVFILPMTALIGWLQAVVLFIVADEAIDPAYSLAD
jgi:hypothetical protein